MYVATMAIGSMVQASEMIQGKIESLTWWNKVLIMIQM